MHIFFIDESGTPPAPTKLRDKYFVIGGVIIPDTVWHKVRDLFVGLKVREKIYGEIKWRYFAAGNKDAQNPMLHMPLTQRNVIRK